MMTLVVFVLLLGLLIFVHELGHFVVARRNGITCHEFGFGFPPRLVGLVKDNGKWRIIGGKDKKEYRGTIYSLNWIPLGGFVRIKGEDGQDRAPDSFAAKSAWVRFKVLVAGVFMNALLAWVLFSLALTLGMPEAVSPEEEADVSVLAVSVDSAAMKMGLRMGDVLRSGCLEGECRDFSKISDLQDFIAAAAGREVILRGLRGREEIDWRGTLPERAPEGKGLLGVQLAATKVVSYSLPEAVSAGAESTYRALGMIFVEFGRLVGRLVRGEAVGESVVGLVGIAVFSGQAAEMGPAYLAHFAAILSANLAVLNILPIPALDGGRILFLLIEVLRRGRPMSRRWEGYAHGISFLLLLALMIVITVLDLLRYF
ncbi:MAG TPA: hypothetical protein ENJ77_00320 [Candidatus Moranbacteria bacterium]|nr:hypothetical protein [Candidatus Moranbacteria bacterium]